MNSNSKKQELVDVIELSSPESADTFSKRQEDNIGQIISAIAQQTNNGLNEFIPMLALVNNIPIGGFSSDERRTIAQIFVDITNSREIHKQDLYLNRFPMGELPNWLHVIIKDIIDNP